MFEKEKLYNAIIYFCKNTKYLSKTKLMKLLYFIDFEHFKQTGKSITGLDYRAWKMGPVPVKVFKEVSNPDDKEIEEYLSIWVEELDNGNKMTRFHPKKDFDSSYFSPRELEILEKYAYIFKESKANEISEASHFPNLPWFKTIKEKGENAEIDYILAIDNESEKEKLAEIQEIEKEIEDLFKS